MTMRSAALLMTVVLAGCGSTSQTPVDSGTPGTCFYRTDCPDQNLFFCNSVTHLCEPGCVNPVDCTDARRGKYALPQCTTDGGGLGCQCDVSAGGVCVVAQCSSDGECTGQVCRNGACVAAPEPTLAVGCTVIPDLVVLKPGAKATFRFTAVSASGAPLLTREGATWAAVSGGPLTGGGSGFSAEFTAQTPTAGVAPAAAVEATVGSVTCRARAIVLPAAPPSGQVWAVVTDELSGRPIGGIEVVLSATDGGVLTSASTDARGLAQLAPTSLPASYSVTAFGPDHAYLTIAGYSGASRYLSMVTRRNQVDKFGGYAGTYQHIPTTTNIHLGVAGVSLAGSVTNLSLGQLLGPLVPTNITLIGNTFAAPVPAGIFLGSGEALFKGTFAAQGLAGVCTSDAGVADEARIAAGTCGTGAAWSLSTDLSIDKIPVSQLTSLGAGLGSLDVAPLVASLAPIFKLFNSTVVRDVSYTLKTTPYDGGLPVFDDQSGFTPLDLEFKQMALGFNFATKLPELPRYRGAYVDAALVLGAASVPGRGLVPLGIGAAVNPAHHAQPDPQDPLTTAGLIPVYMAPTHHGLEGSQYLLGVIAVSSATATDASAAQGASAILARVPNNRLVFNPDGTSPIDVSGLSFPVYPDGARFNFLDVDQDGLKPRTFGFVGTPPDLSGAGLLRVTFADDLDHRWEVVMDASAAATGFTLPKPPSGADRIFALGLASGQRSSLVVQTQRLHATPAAPTGAGLTFNDVVELGSTNAERTLELLTGFTFLSYGRPTIAFTTPATNPATVAGASVLTMKVTGVRIGTEAVVALSFSPGGGTCPSTPTILTVEGKPGNGVLSSSLPIGCAGSQTVTATLLRPGGTTPVAPGVATSLVLTIQ